MGNDSQCPSGGSADDAARKTVIFAFDLAKAEIVNLPKQIETALNSPAVKTAMNDVLGKFALKMAGTGTPVLSGKDAKDLGEALLKGAGDKVQDAMLAEIRKTPQFQQLDKSLKNFEMAAKCTPMGAWVASDKGKYTLYVVGIGLALGGAAALYVTKTGGALVNLPVSQIKGKPFEIFKLGGFSMKGQLLEFKPDTQTVGAGLIAVEKWQKLQLSFQAGIVAAGKDVKEVNGQAVLKTDDFSVTLSGVAVPAQKRFALGLGLGFSGKGLPGPLNVTLGASVWDSQIKGGSLSATLPTKSGDFGLTGQIGQQAPGAPPQTSVMATYVMHF